MSTFDLMRVQRVKTTSPNELYDITLAVSSFMSSAIVTNNKLTKMHTYRLKLHVIDGMQKI